MSTSRTINSKLNQKWLSKKRLDGGVVEQIRHGLAVVSSADSLQWSVMVWQNSTWPTYLGKSARNINNLELGAALSLVAN